MKKLFLLVALLLFFTSVVFAQEPVPITADPNTANEQVEVFNEYFLSELNIKFSPDGYDKSRITLIAGIGKRTDVIDPVTGFRLSVFATTKEIYSGTLAGYRDGLLSRAVSANLITEQQKQDIINGQIGIYLSTDQGFKTTLNILVGLGDIELKAVKKVIPAN
ncbi:MAG: hypothetical protein WAQ98_20700 [Blastocatellia bacterium]